MELLMLEQFVRGEALNPQWASTITSMRFRQAEYSLATALIKYGSQRATTLRDTNARASNGGK
jgi:hypothetical protein